MNKIIQIIGNLKLDNVLHTAGSVIEADVATLEELIKDGTIRILEGVETVAKGLELIAEEELAKLRATENEAPVVESQNTWGPSSEPVVAPETPSETITEPEAKPDAPLLSKFEVLKEFEVTNTESKNFGKHVVGSVIEADATAAKNLVDNGTITPVKAETGDNL